MFILGFISGVLICLIIFMISTNRLKKEFKSTLEMRDYNLDHWQLIANAARETNKIKKNGKQ